MTQPLSWPDGETIRKENEGLLNELLETLAGIHTTALVEEGDIQSRLQDAIRKNNIDLVVIGTRGRTGLGKVLNGLGSRRDFPELDLSSTEYFVERDLGTIPRLRK
jgi:universal stress protein family protein